MGSDMYMEAQNFHPRPLRVGWRDRETLFVEKDYPISGYQTVYEGNIDEGDSTQVALLKAIGVSKIPERPPVVKSTWDEMVAAIYDGYGYTDRETFDAVYAIIKNVAENGIIHPGDGLAQERWV